jgi:2'-5' RNA ligase superfamily protein
MIHAVPDRAWRRGDEAVAELPGRRPFLPAMLLLGRSATTVPSWACSRCPGWWSGCSWGHHDDQAPVRHPADGPAHLTDIGTVNGVNICILNGGQQVALAVCLLFDRRSGRAVRALWDRLERAGVPSLRSHAHGRHLPHVSYAVLLRIWDLATVSGAVAGLGPVGPVELTFDGVGLFRRGRAWLLAGAAAEFVAGQERVVEAVLGTGAELHKHYRPGRWPHCSVAPPASLAQLPVLAAAIYDVLPLEARLDRIAMIDSTTGEVWPVSAGR